MRCRVFGPGAAPAEETALASGPLDAVFLWTNGSDPRLSRASKEDHSPMRVREWNELYYALKLFRANAVNVRRVLVLAPRGVRPYYADEVAGWVSFVDTETILPPKWQATSDSHTIEWHLEALKTQERLTDPIILMNDDWMVTRRFDLTAYANELAWCPSRFGRSATFGDPEDERNIFIASLKTANRMFRKLTTNRTGTTARGQGGGIECISNSGSQDDEAALDSPYRPGNFMLHVPVVVRSRTMAIVEQYFGLESQHALVRSKHNMPFEYTLAQVEHQLLGAKHRSHASCEAGYSKVSLSGPLDKLRVAFCNALEAGPKRFVCINDDLQPRFLAVDGAAGQFRSLVDEFLRSLVAKGLGQETPLKC